MWDQRYGEPGYAYGKAPNDFLVEVAGALPLGPVLSLAEGEGRNAVYLAGRGHAVTGVDSSQVGLAKAQTLAAERGVNLTTVCADLADYHIEAGKWAAVLSIFCHLPEPLRTRILREAVAGLRPGGVLVLEAYTPAQLELRTGGPPVVEMLYRLDDVRRALEGLELRIARERRRDVREGRFHSGLAAVVQVLGVKR